VSYNPVADHHQWLYANCLSQSQALMLGKSRAEAEAELRASGLAEDEVQRLAPHKVIPGNRPSNTLVLERISPRRLGALVAMYEHKVFVQSVIWGINAFDQWGVELGKELGKGVYQRLTGWEQPPAEDASTHGQIDFLRGRHRGRPASRRVQCPATTLLPLLAVRPGTAPLRHCRTQNSGSRGHPHGPCISSRRRDLNQALAWFTLVGIVAQQ